MRNRAILGDMAKPIKVSVFLKPEDHLEYTMLAKQRKLSLSRLVEHILDMYRRDLTRRSKDEAAA